MRGRAAAGREAPDHHVDDEEDPFSFPARSRLRSPSRAAVPNATQDRDSLRALFECTRGGSWRTSLGWPSWDCVRRTSQNPFGKVGDVDEPKRRPPTAVSEAPATGAAGAGSGCSTPTRTGGGGSPGNPFARAEIHNGNPFAPPTPTTRASLSKTPASPPAGADASGRRATAAQVVPPVCSTSPTGTPTAMRRATDHLPSPPPSPPSPASRGASPLAAAASARKVWGGRRSPSPPTDTQTRSTLLDRPRPRGSNALEAGSRYRSPSPPADAQRRSVLLDPPRQRGSIEAGAAWFGVSLGTAGRVTDLKLVDNGLVGILPSALGGLEMLRYLHLGRNALSGGLRRSISECTDDSFRSEPFFHVEPRIFVCICR